MLDQGGARQPLPTSFRPAARGMERLAEADLVLRHGPMDERLRHACGKVAVFAMTLLPSDLYALDGSARHLALARLRGKRVHAVAGIGRQERFFDTLREAGLEPICHAFPDHHRFEGRGDLRFDDAYPVLMTAKDAVKCASFAPPTAWVFAGRGTDRSRRIQNRDGEARSWTVVCLKYWFARCARARSISQRRPGARLQAMPASPIRCVTASR